MEENKKCVDGICEKCSGGGCCSHRCCGHHKCGRIIMRIILGLVLVGIGYCAGTMAVGRSAFRGWENQRFMMDRFYGPDESINTKTNTGSGSVKINVIPEEKGTTSTKTPPVLE